MSKAGSESVFFPFNSVHPPPLALLTESSPSSIHCPWLRAASQAQRHTHTFTHPHTQKQTLTHTNTYTHKNKHLHTHQLQEETSLVDPVVVAITVPDGLWELKVAPEGGMYFRT